MANPSFPIDDEDLEDFDRAIMAKKMNGELPMDASRSDVIRQLVQEFTEEHEDLSNEKTTTAD